MLVERLATTQSILRKIVEGQGFIDFMAGDCIFDIHVDLTEDEIAFIVALIDDGQTS